MSLTNYLWFDSYLNAICETDDTRSAVRIREAIGVLERRLLSPARPNREEEIAIKDALKGLAILMAQRDARIDRRVDNLLQGIPD